MIQVPTNDARGQNFELRNAHDEIAPGLQYFMNFPLNHSLNFGRWQTFSVKIRLLKF